MSLAMTGPAEDFRARFARLREELAPGVSIEDLHYRARRRLEDAGEPAVSLSTVQKRLAPGSIKGATADLLVTLAAALDVEPETFDEYRLAKLRALFDEDAVGLVEAVSNASDAVRVLVTTPITATGVDLHDGVAAQFAKPRQSSNVVQMPGGHIRVDVEAARAPDGTDAEFERALAIARQLERDPRLLSQVADLVEEFSASAIPSAAAEARQREAEALQERAQRQRERPEGEPDTTRAPRGRRRGAR